MRDEKREILHLQCGECVIRHLSYEQVIYIPRQNSVSSWVKAIHFKQARSDPDAEQEDSAGQTAQQPGDQRQPAMNLITPYSQRSADAEWSF